MTKTKNTAFAIAAILAVTITPYALQASFAVVTDSVSVTAPPDGQSSQLGHRNAGKCNNGLGDIPDLVIVTTSSTAGNVVEAKYDASQCASVSEVDEYVFINNSQTPAALGHFFTTTGDTFYNGLAFKPGDIIRVDYTFNVT